MYFTACAIAVCPVSSMHALPCRSSTLRLLALLSTANAVRLSSFWQLKPADLAAGDVVVPTMARRWEDQATFRAARERMFAAGLYPGVDYTIEETDSGGAEEERLSLTVRPIYPLIPKLVRRSQIESRAYTCRRCAARASLCARTLHAHCVCTRAQEREWPITVAFEIAPRWMSPSAYNVLVAGGTLGLAAAGVVRVRVGIRARLGLGLGLGLDYGYGYV